VGTYGCNRCSGNGDRVAEVNDGNIAPTATFSHQLLQHSDEALAVAAVSGHAEAEFMVGSVFDAAGEIPCAMEWYRRAALRNYIPAVLQMYAIR
jgi:hypothetical protein